MFSLRTIQKLSQIFPLISFFNSWNMNHFMRCLFSPDDDVDEASRVAKSKRLIFQRSRQDKGANSMPSESWAKIERGEKSNRRASLPHNLKIPVIIFTPPSPSPDINDPDYPEFFQDRPYLESKVNCMSTSVDDDIATKMVTETSATSGSLESTKEMVSGGFGLSTASCRNDDVYLRLRSKSFTSTVDTESLSDDDDEEDYDMVQSTPEFDEILSNARTEREILNCLKFKEENKL